MFFLGIFERFKKLFIREQKGVVEPFFEFWAGWGKPQPVSYSQLYSYYKNHPLVKSSVDSLAGMVAGSGFYTTVDDSQNSRQVRAKEIVDEFNAKVNMDELLLEVVKDMFITGNSFLEKVFNENGRLRESITVRGLNVLMASHWKYTEYGVKPHKSLPKKAKVLAFQVKDETVFAKKVKHPGFKGRRWVRKSLDEAKKRLREVLKQLVLKG